MKHRLSAALLLTPSVPSLRNDFPQPWRWQTPALPSRHTLLMRADRAFVIEWSQTYLNKSTKKARDEEEDLLTRVGPSVRQRGYYRVGEMERVYRWKLRDQRNRGLLAKNTPAQVKAITESALAAPEHLQLYAIQRLHGVGDAVASALLTFPFPRRHTVIDFKAARALEALEQQGQLPFELLWRAQPADDKSRPPYPPYWMRVGG